MTNFEKYVYNTYLKTLGTQKNRPYKFRDNFDSDFCNDSNLAYTQTIKLALFFTHHKHVNVEMFFYAPYAIYGNQETFYLDFYLTQKAVKTYTLYSAQLLDEDPDCTNQLTFIINSLKFIRQFCTEQNKSITEYLTISTGATPDFVVHILERKCSVYCLFAYPNFDDELFKIDKTILEFILGREFIVNLNKFKIRFGRSKKAQIIAKNGLKKIENSVEKH